MSFNSLRFIIERSEGVIVLNAECEDIHTSHRYRILISMATRDQDHWTNRISRWANWNE